MTLKQKDRLTLAAAVLAIIAGFSCRMLAKSGIAPQVFSFIRTFIYLSFFIAWGFSLEHRIQQRQARRFMIATDGLIIFWLIIRTVKFYLVTTNAAARYLWYLYYIPMLFVPLLGLMIALSLGKPDNFRLPKSTSILWSITALAVLFVLTNDFHQLAFRFPEELPVSQWSDSQYSYGAVYYFVIALEVGCAAAALIIMAVKCRVPGAKRYFWLPPLPLLLSLVYTLFYALGVDWLRIVLGDLTVTQCILFAATFEACIRCGLIQSNTRYADLFEASGGCSATITDRDFNTKYAACDAERFTPEQLRAAEKEPLSLGMGKTLRTIPLHGGFAAWTEDNSELLELTEDLRLTREELKERNALLRTEYEHDKKRREIEEQNRLYDMLQRVTQKQIDGVAALVREYHAAENDPQKSRGILAEITVLCSFIKRRRHLALLCCENEEIPAAELKSAVSESLRALKYLGVEGSVFCTASGNINGNAAEKFYEFFEAAAEAKSLSSLEIRIAQPSGKPRISINAAAEADFSEISADFPSAEISRDGGEWSLLLEWGGENV